MKAILLNIFLLISTIIPFTSTAQNKSLKSTNNLPSVFLIGEHETEYQILLEQYQNMLVSVCDYKVDRAYEVWNNFLYQIQEYSESINFDIKGSNIWINVFFKKDGSVSNIAYYLKPKSRNINTNQLTAVFKSFIKRHKIDLTYKDSFFHSGQARFPIFIKIPTK